MGTISGVRSLVQKRFITQFLSVPVKNSNYRYRVSLLKVPSNYGYYSSRVNRLYNEDNYNVAILNVDMSDNKIYEEETVTNETSLYTKVFNFNVFDGHGGEKCSKFLAENLSQNVEEYRLSLKSIDYLLKKYVKDIGGYWRRWYRRKNQKINKILEISEDMDPSKIDDLKIENILKLKIFLSFLETDYKFLVQEDHNEKHSGSTATSMFIYTLDPNPNLNIKSKKNVTHSPNSIHEEEQYFYQPATLSKLLIAHCGDTRAIICDKDGVAHGLTIDHHPSNPLETRRLTKYASDFFMTDSFGEERFINFANTRSFGDLQGKDKGISAEPEFFEFLIGDSKKLNYFKKLNRDNKSLANVRDFGGDEAFLVLVTDGVSNYLTDQEIVDIVMSTANNKGLLKGTPHEAAKEVVKFIESIGGSDNATCNVVKLSGWGNWPMIDRTGKLRESKMMKDIRGNRMI